MRCLFCLPLLLACERASETPDASVDLATGDIAAVKASVTVGDQTLNHLDASFVGLSYEKSALALPLFSAENAALVSLFTRLGASLLRVGGNSVDQTTWTPNGAGLTAKQIAPPDVDRLAAFLRATNWQVIYGVNLGASTASAAADEASYAAQALGDRLYGFEIGNEPDLYQGKYRPSPYPYTSFRGEWESYASAIRAKVPNAPLTGPASATHPTTWTVPFAADESGKIILVTQHWYLANGMDPSSTIDKLLMPDPKLPGELTSLHQAATYRLAECNSYYNGGAPNVSDSYASALWVVNFLFTVAEGGATGVNLHGGGNGPGYTPIANDGMGRVVGPRPEYDGALLFAQAARGDLVATTVSGPSTLSAHAVRESDGSTDVVLVNSDENSVGVTIDLGRSVSTASVLALTGPSLSSTSGVLVGGAAVAADGGWSPSESPASVNAQQVFVLVPAVAALRIHAAH
jgi:hypothetical protein